MSEANSTEPATVEYRTLEPLGFPGYRVGDDGSVWTCKKTVGNGRYKGSHSEIGDQWRRLATCPGTNGHLHVTLCPGRRTKLVHRLILEAFAGPRPKGMQCRHFPDRNPANNRLDNLQWGTGKENQADRRVHGTAHLGEKHPLRKLTDEMVRAIREEWATHRTKQRTLARKYGVNQRAIWSVIHRKTWTHVV